MRQAAAMCDQLGAAVRLRGVCAGISLHTLARLMVTSVGNFKSLMHPSNLLFSTNECHSVPPPGTGGSPSWRNVCFEMRFYTELELRMETVSLLPFLKILLLLLFYKILQRHKKTTPTSFAMSNVLHR